MDAVFVFVDPSFAVLRYSMTYGSRVTMLGLRGGDTFDHSIDSQLARLHARRGLGHRGMNNFTIILQLRLITE